MKPTPILFLSDSPELTSGLARIGRDLAVHVSTLPQFRVGYLGRAGHGSSKLPFPQYNFPESDQWGEGHIERAWMDFAGDETGIIFTIWDASRLHWFANPNGIGGSLGDFLRSGRFQRWGYFPVDSQSINGGLTALSTDTLRYYNRVLGYSIFGAEVLGKSLNREVDWIPHGIVLDKFEPRDKVASRMSLGVKKTDLVIGCVMTNQARKDWGLAFATIARLKLKHPNLKFWAHIDVPEREWDIRALATDFNLSPILSTSGQFNDEELSYCYSACDLTILPSLGEGFGYPIAESMACGVPVVHGNYAAGPQLIPDERWLVDPIGERVDTPHNCLRPVFSPVDWVEAIERVLADPPTKEVCQEAVAHLDWKLLWPGAWKKFFLEGIEARS